MLSVSADRWRVYHCQSKDDAPIKTVAAEELASLVFVGSMEQIKGELQAAYPLQLSARIDQSRKCLIFDCFEYKPYQLIDLSQEDISAVLPTERGWKRWQHGYRWTEVEEDDEWDDGVEGTEYWGGDAQMVCRSRETQELTIYCGLTGHFAYNRCLRFRLPFLTTSAVFVFKLMTLHPTSLVGW